MKIEVTQNDIDTGKPYKADLCPLALAIQRAVQPQYLAVGTKTVQIKMQDGRPGGESYNLPENAIDFRQRFDNQSPYYPVAPFTFDLPIPGENQ